MNGCFFIHVQLRGIKTFTGIGLQKQIAPGFSLLQRGCLRLRQLVEQYGVAN
jgi:hypothetical protein